jgi:O-antigen ligase
LGKTSNSRRAEARRAARKRSSGGQTPGTSSAAGRKAEASAGARAGKAGPRAGEAAERSGEAMSATRRVAWWALVAMVFVVPVAMSNLTFLGFRAPFTADQFDFVKVACLRALALVALGAWAWDLLRRGGRLRHTPVDWLVLALVVWVAITTATSLHWPTSLLGARFRYEGLASFADYAVIFFLVLQFADSAQHVRTLARALFFSSVIVAGYGVLQFVGWDPIAWGQLSFETGRAFSTFGNPDLLGGFLIFSTTVAAALAVSEERRGWRLVFWIGAAVNGLALIVAFTRGAWIGGALALVLLSVFAWRGGARMRRVDWAPVGAALALATVVVWRSLSSTNDVTNFRTRLGSIFQFSSGSGQTRTEIWRAAVSAVKQRPVQGWGADTFRQVYPRFKLVESLRHGGVGAVADNAHSYPLQLAVGIGIPGLLMLYGVFVWAGVRSFAGVFGRNDDPARLLRGAFWAASAGYLVHLFAGLSVTGSTFLLWVALGVVLAPTARSVRVRAPRWGGVVAAIVVALAVAGIAYQGVLVGAEHAYATALGAAVGPARVDAARRASRLDPLSGAYRVEVGRAYADLARADLGAAQQAQQAGDDPGVYLSALKGNFGRAETAFKDAIAFAPDEYDDYVWLAELYMLGGDAIDKRYYDDVVRVARQAIAIEPYGPSVRVLLARALLSQGKIVEGVTELEGILKMAPSYGPAALLLAQAYEQMGRADEALAVLRSVEALAPGQPGVADAIQQLETSRKPSP